MGLIEGRLEKERQNVEKMAGEPIRAVLPGLAASGAFAAVLGSTAGSALGNGLLGTDLWRQANANGAGVAGSTFTKNTYGLLAVTGAGRIKLWRTSTGWRGTKIEALVGDWARGDVEVGIGRTGALFKFAVLAPATGQSYLLEMAAIMGGDSIVKPFAEAAGVTVEQI